MLGCLHSLWNRNYIFIWFYIKSLNQLSILYVKICQEIMRGKWLNKITFCLQGIIKLAFQATATGTRSNKIYFNVFQSDECIMVITQLQGLKLADEKIKLVMIFSYLIFYNPRPLMCVYGGFLAGPTRYQHVCTNTTGVQPGLIYRISAANSCHHECRWPQYWNGYCSLHVLQQSVIPGYTDGNVCCFCSA